MTFEIQSFLEIISSRGPKKIIADITAGNNNMDNIFEKTIKVNTTPHNMALIGVLLYRVKQIRIRKKNIGCW